LGRTADLKALGAELARAGFPVADGEHQPDALEFAVRRRAAAELRVLARWCGDRAALLPVIFEDEDRRSLRAILRGTLQHRPSEARLRGLVPTPTLPERALAEAAAAPTPGAVSTLLTLWNHPFAAGLRVPAGAAAPDPLALDLALDRAWAARAVSGASRGGRELVRFVEDAIDLMNAATALVRTGVAPARGPDLYLDGGHRLTRTAFTALLARERGVALQALGDLFETTPYGRALRGAGARGLEDALLAARLDVQRRAARRAPLGVAPALWYALELRSESLTLSRLIWSLALGAPAA
jgi:vacuolar-type H+-ATPase subunit C/Vma6